MMRGADRWQKRNLRDPSRSRSSSRRAAPTATHTTTRLSRRASISTFPAVSCRAPRSTSSWSAWRPETSSRAHARAREGPLADPLKHPW